MKNLISTLFVFVFLHILIGRSYSQDFFNINFSGDQSAQINPKSIAINGGNKFILYDKQNNSNPSNPIIGVSKIDNTTNQIIFDLQIDLSNNTGYGFNHNISAIDLEIYGESIYALLSINNGDMLLLQINKSDGSLVKKEIIPVLYNGLLSSSIFVPTDLFLGMSDDDNDPYIAILGKSTQSTNQFSKMVLFYKKLSQPNYSTISYDFEYIGTIGTLIDQCKIDGFNKRPLKGGLSSENEVLISVAFNGAFLLTLRFDLNTNSLSEYTHRDFSAYGNGGLLIRGLSHFFYDGIQVYFGQFTDYYDHNYNGDFFVVYGDELFTYNNSNFRFVEGESHPNNTDWIGGLGGYSSSTVASFSGLFYDPNDISHPRYAVGKVDLFSSSLFTSPLITYSYTLRDMGADNINNISNLFGSSTYDYSNNQITSFLYRKPITISDASNAYYMPQMSGNTSCNDVITFSRTYDKSMYQSSGYWPVSVYTSQIVTPSDFTINFNSSSPGQISSLCIERLTNNDPGMICDPILGCYLAPQSNSIKNTSTNISSEEVKNSSDDIRISPNPAKDQIICTSNTLIKQVLIYDGLGKKIVERDNINDKQTTLQVSSLQSGSYFVRILKTNGAIFVKKIIKL